MLIDSHCHLDRLDLSPFEGDFSNYIAQAKAANLEEMLCVSISLEAWPAMAQLIKPYEGIKLSIGVHPNETDCMEPSVEELVDHANSDERIVAIGESGLDYFRSKQGEDMSWQHERFERHIEAAHQTNKPLIIHMRNATEDTLNKLERLACREAGGVMHCFSENWSAAVRALDFNYYISFSGIVTFNSAKDIQEAARKMPIEKMLVETDSPYLAPVPHRGKPNYPHYVRHTIDFIASLRGISPQALEEQLEENYHHFIKV